MPSTKLDSRKSDAEEKRKWDAKATMDRERYEKEKMAYDGPWSVPIGHRQRKDASAPKRPASAFLAFSNSRRAAAKRDNKDASNAEISRILSKMWKEAPEEVRKIYQDEEATARAEYKIKIAEWRVEDKKNKDAERKDPLEIYEESGHIGACRFMICWVLLLVALSVVYVSQLFYFCLALRGSLHCYRRTPHFSSGAGHEDQREKINSQEGGG